MEFNVVSCDRKTGSSLELVHDGVKLLCVPRSIPHPPTLDFASIYSFKVIVRGASKEKGKYFDKLDQFSVRGYDSMTVNCVLIHFEVCYGNVNVIKT